MPLAAFLVRHPELDESDFRAIKQLSHLVQRPIRYRSRIVPFEDYFEPKEDFEVSETMTTFEETVNVQIGSRSVELDDNRGELICNDCGLVIEENIIDPGPDWRNYQGQEDASRVGAPDNPLIHDKGR